MWINGKLETLSILQAKKHLTEKILLLSSNLGTLYALCLYPSQ